MGIGLTLVKRITEMHGGTVTASSSTETGTTFTVRLPLAEVRMPEQFSTPTKSVNKLASGRRVVIIDDN